ncbi:Uncharacterised protein [Mycobacteroides abscessus subsp. abscessus]|nr:Uncharacterised protein [Mycobacteroides abscessus subsp. abscessus]
MKTSRVDFRLKRCGSTLSSARIRIRLGSPPYEVFAANANRITVENWTT